MTQIRLIVTVALFFLLFDNYSFYENVLKVYPLNETGIFHLVSVVLLLFTFTIFLFTLFSSKYTTKPLLIMTLLVSSFTTYFMSSYHVVIDSTMIRNTLQTDMHESLDLLSVKLFLYILFLGLLPSIWVYRKNIEYLSLKVELFRKVKTLFLTLLVMVLLLLGSSKFFTSFFREHIPLRYHTNPTFWIYSIGEYIASTVQTETIVVKSMGLNATIPPSTDTTPNLVIMVVGEASRADHFSLNGYEKETNPLLKKEHIINLPNVSSCGTSTAHSVPCMFSFFDRDDFNYKKGISYENVLDVIYHTKKVEILWRDNNSDSKGVALRVPYADYKQPSINSYCPEGECRDKGMLIGLQEYINKKEGKNILIVLHQMGNHGPSYYKRYTKEFEKFTPVCKTNQLEECTQESISNAYDNAILYSDYFLSEVIQLLKENENNHKTSMIYMSDHGESLGEHGLYLHGLPYFMAPEAQTHIGAFMWFGKSNQRDFNSQKAYSHDNLVHTLLGLFNVKTKLYKEELDILR